jgi:hypothetical protein
LQGALIVQPLQNSGKKHRSQQITRTVWWVFDQPVFGKQGMVSRQIEIAGSAGHHGDRRCNQDTRGTEGKGRLEDCGVGFEHRTTAQPGKLEAVWSRKVGKWQQPVPDGDGSGFRHIETASVTDDRIAGVENLRISLFESFDQTGDTFHLMRRPKIARQYRPNLANPG